MDKKRSLILSATPLEPTELATVFSDQTNSIRRKLEVPPKLRDDGWGLGTGDQAKFLQGELISVESHRMTIDLYRDGSLIFLGGVSRDFLAWSDPKDLRIHPLALVELTVNFTRFYQEVLKDFRVRPQRIGFKAELRNMHLSNQKTTLRAGTVQDFQYGSYGVPNEAPDDDWSKEIVVASEGYDPDLVAYSLLRELYLWFGHADEAIPYTKEVDGITVIDADAIAKIR